MSTNIVSRLSLTTVDQAVWSLGNFALSLGLARASRGAAEFANYSIPLGVIFLSTGLIGAFSYEPLILIAQPQRRLLVRPSVQIAGVSSAVFGVALAGALYWFGVSVSPQAIVLLAVACVVANITETLRGLLTFAGETRALLLLDLVWTAIVLGLIIVLALTGNSPTWVLASWVIGAVTATAVVWALELRRHVKVGGLNPAQDADYLSVAKSAGRKFAAEYVLAGGLGQLVPLIVALIAGAAAAGSLRLVLVAFGPVTTLQSAVQRASYAVFRDRLETGEQVVRLAVRAALVLAASALFWGLALMSMGRSGGAAIFGVAWLSSYSLLPLCTIYQSFVLLAAPAVALVRGRLLFAEAVRRRGVTALFSVLAVAAGAALDNAIGALVGMLAANILAAGLFWQLAVSGKAEIVSRRSLTGPLPQEGV